MAFGNYAYNPYVNPWAAPYQPQMQQPVQQMPTQQMPQMAQMQQAQPMQNGFVWVDGIEEAKNFYVAPNNAVQLWDKNAPCIYKKSADAAGKPSMQIFDLVERVQNTDETHEKRATSDFALKSELLDLEQRVIDLEASKRRTKAKETKEEVEDA